MEVMFDFLQWKKRHVEKAPLPAQEDESGSIDDSEGADTDMPPLKNVIP